MSLPLIIHDTPQTKNPCYIRARPMKPIGILVHSTGANNKRISRYVDHVSLLGKNPYGNHWNKSSANKCMHAFIGLDAMNRIAVAHTLPYNVASWGCGAGRNGSYNRDPTGHIQFEVCEDNNRDPVYYREAFDVTLQYCVYLCKMFNIPANMIVSHQEAASRGYASFHYDPDTWMRRQGDSMNAFRQRVRVALGQEGSGNVTQPVEPIILVFGMRGEPVREVQKALQSLGYDIGRITQADGIFGAKTEEAIKHYQRNNGFTVTGTWGPNEAAKLKDKPVPASGIVNPPPAVDKTQVLAQYSRVKAELDALGKLLM